VGIIRVGTAMKTPEARCTWLANRLMVQYSLPYDAQVSVGLYSLDGRNVAECVNKFEKAGLYTTTWNANSVAMRPLSPATYLVRMKFGDRIETQKIMLTK
jgi:hypothetical protein